MLEVTGLCKRYLPEPDEPAPPGVPGPEPPMKFRLIATLKAGAAASALLLGLAAPAFADSAAAPSAMDRVLVPGRIH